MSEETSQTVAAKSGVGMKDSHCDKLELRFRLKAGEIDQDAFIEAAGIEDRKDFIDADGDFAVGVNLGPREEATDYHAHLRLWVFKEDGTGRVDITYHDSKADTIDDEPPYVEECLQWLGGFIKPNKVTANITASYLFDDSFTPVISLPFPLVPTEKALAGALVTGLSLLFPREEKSEMAIIQNSDEGTFVSLSIKSDIVLKEFELLSQLESLSSTINCLIKEREAKNEKGGTQTKGE